MDLFGRAVVAVLFAALAYCMALLVKVEWPLWSRKERVGVLYLLAAMVLTALFPLLLLY